MQTNHNLHVNDQQSTVAQIRKNNPGRLFYVIEQIHTLPNINYLAKVRNTEEIIGTIDDHEGGGHAGQSAEPVKAAEHTEK